MKTKILTGLAILVGLMLVNSGLNKFLNYMPMEMAEDATAIINSFIASKWLWPLVAMVEISGGILFALPKTRALGAIVLLPVTIGILLFNLTWTPSTAPVAAVILAVNIWAIVEARKQYTPLIKN
ncbi:DoxX protein [Marivirga sericea]|uniref:DoxX protein n=1 Tax=Marivirga sericea TaxID=1028 RepID=A0A1X7KZZ9_9BACT|nr:DoxX family membrane protein [Marivirga sericea]SMG47010.1 DoxX protein [Marivirga sericea]